MIDFLIRKSLFCGLTIFFTYCFLAGWNYFIVDLLEFQTMELDFFQMFFVIACIFGEVEVE